MINIIRVFLFHSELVRFLVPLIWKKIFGTNIFNFQRKSENSFGKFFFISKKNPSKNCKLIRNENENR